MLDKIHCICVDDADRPKEVPAKLWLKKDKEYHVTHIFQMVNQKGIKGCEIAEIDIGHLKPYNSFRLDRFAFTKEGLDKLIELIKQCTELNNVDINSIVEKIQIKEEILA